MVLCLWIRSEVLVAPLDSSILFAHGPIRTFAQKQLFVGNQNREFRAHGISHLRPVWKWGFLGSLCQGVCTSLEQLPGSGQLNESAAFAPTGRIRPDTPSFAQNRSVHSEPLCCSSLVVIQSDIQINPDSVYLHRRTELNDLIPTVRDIRHLALRTPIMLKRQIVKLSAVQESFGADIQPRYVPRRAHCFVPGLAVVNHVLCLRRAVHSFEVAPKTNSIGKTDSLRIRRCFLSVLLS